MSKKSLEPAKVELLVRLVVTNKDGTVESDTGHIKSHSFVKQFLEVICAYMLQGGLASPYQSIHDVSNNAISIPSIGYGIGRDRIMTIHGAIDDITKGIVVGTGTNAEGNTDYALQTICAQGSGSNQFDYGEQGFTEPAVVGANVDFVLTRALYNASGSSITVNEIGIYMVVSPSITGYAYFCAVRDAITGVAVAATKTLTVQYTWRTTV